MTKTDEEIAQDWKVIDNGKIEKICTILQGHENDIQEYLMICVASLCNVDVKQMMTSFGTVQFVYARWLYWYAYKYMTGATNKHISEVSAKYGRVWTKQCIGKGMNKMLYLIINDDVWAKRWDTIKRIIKLRSKDEVETITVPKDEKITIVVPRALKDLIDIKYKE